MDKLAKIKVEIERLKEKSKSVEMDTEYTLAWLLDFIDSLPEEPVSKDLKEEIKRYQQEIYDRDTTVKDIARHFAKWGKKQAEIEIQAQSMALAHGCPIEEPVKKQQEILHDCKTCKENGDSLTYSDAIEYGIRLQKEKEDDALVIANMAGVEEGKQMMKEKMMKDAVGAYIGDDLGVGKSLRLDTDALMRAWIKYEVGTKLKVIIIKDD